MDDGTEAYTRSGAFKLDATGQLVTQGNRPVMTEGGPISFSVEDGNIQITEDGTIATNLGIKGRLRVVDFEDVRELEKSATPSLRATIHSQPFKSAWNREPLKVPMCMASPR